MRANSAGQSPRHRAAGRSRYSTVCGLLAATLIAGSSSAGGQGGKGGGGIAGTTQIQTTLQDFFQPGTQPLGEGVKTPFMPLVSSTTSCRVCHANYGDPDPFLTNEPYTPWAASMMGQAARDPLFHAGLAIANQDAVDAGAYCIRCHAPGAFLSGHSVPTDASAFSPQDFQSVSCNFCHRLVNPAYVPGTSPVEDESIVTELSAAGLLPPESGNARYVVDPTDSRRGPFDDIPLNVHSGVPQPEIIPSPFHHKAELCWTCHDVSNPLMSKQPDGSFALNQLDAPHPTHNQREMLPLHRTYSEWKNSYYSTIGVQHNGRFGGNHPTGIMKDCQDCHMPDTIGYGCSIEGAPFFQRPDVPQHSFIGSNYWVLNAVRTVDANNDGEPDFPDNDTDLSDDSVAAQIARNTDFLEKASDLFLVQIGQNLRTRLLNRTGHKLPTGFPDGRQIWVNVKFLDCNEDIVAERGAYDWETATVTTDDTKVYRITLGIDGADYAQSVGHPEGPTMHFMLANKILMDNRIPPAGFSTVLADQAGTAAVGATYLNGQNWDDTIYAIPAGAKSALVTVYYQLTSKEFAEHLRDDNTTNNLGQVAYDLWVQHGMSQPVVMDMVQIQVYQRPDVNKDGVVNIDDLLAVIAAWGDCAFPPPGPCPPDVDQNGTVNIDDLLSVIAAWGPC